MNEGERKTLPLIRMPAGKHRWNDRLEKLALHLDRGWEEG